MQKQMQENQGQTKNCPKCGELIQSSAKKCKHCQADLRSWFARHKILTGILGFIAFIIFVGIVGGGTEDTTENTNSNGNNGDTTVTKTDDTKKVNNNKETVKKTEEIKYIKITANALCDEYESNEISADKKFKDKYLEVTGVVEAIDSDFLDNAVVRLKCGGEYSFKSVSCSFSSTDEAAKIKKGSKIVVLGKSTGEVVGSPTIKECKVK